MQWYGQRAETETGLGRSRVPVEDLHMKALREESSHNGAYMEASLESVFLCPVSSDSNSTVFHQFFVKDCAGMCRIS